MKKNLNRILDFNHLMIGFLFFTNQAFAQILPITDYKDFGFEKPIQKIEETYYSVEEDSIEKAEEIMKIFNKEGKIELVESKSFLDNSWYKEQYAYKNGLLAEQNYQCSKNNLNYKKKFTYNKQNKVSKIVKIYADKSKETTTLLYKDSLLHQTKTKSGNFELIVTNFYSKNGKLYKEEHLQKEKDKPNLVTNYLFVEGKEILSYSESKNSIYINAYLENLAEFKFSVADGTAIQNKLTKSIEQFEKEAPQDKLPFNLQDYSEQTLQAYEKNKNDMHLYQLLLFSTEYNKYQTEKLKSVVAEAAVDLEQNKISTVGFFKTTYTNGRHFGSTNFRESKLNEFRELLKELKPDFNNDN